MFYLLIRQSNKRSPPKHCREAESVLNACSSLLSTACSSGVTLVTARRLPAWALLGLGCYGSAWMSQRESCMAVVETGGMSPRLTSEVRLRASGCCCCCSDREIVFMFSAIVNVLIFQNPIRAEQVSWSSRTLFVLMYHAVGKHCPSLFRNSWRFCL